MRDLFGRFLHPQLGEGRPCVGNVPETGHLLQLRRRLRPLQSIETRITRWKFVIPIPSASSGATRSKPVTAAASLSCAAAFRACPLLRLGVLCRKIEPIASRIDHENRPRLTPSGQVKKLGSWKNPLRLARIPSARPNRTTTPSGSAFRSSGTADRIRRHRRFGALSGTQRQGEQYASHTLQYSGCAGIRLPATAER